MTATADKVRLAILREAQSLMDRAALAEHLPDLPNGFNVYSYNLTPVSTWSPTAHVVVEAYQSDDDSWQDRVHALGGCLRAFHAHDIKREVRENGTVRYEATGSLANDAPCALTLTVWQGGINPACHVETETFEETITRTRVKVVCD